MNPGRRLSPVLLAAALVLVLGGCATTRSELRVASPVAAPASAPNANAPAAFIRTVKDDRKFEQAPPEPSTPSLGLEGATQATAETKLRAIGRKRNGYGRALGDVLLENGQTVESIVRENLAAALREAGYNVRSEAAADPRALIVDVRITKFWAWVQPGFWAITVKAEIATDVTLSNAASATMVNVQLEDAKAIVTDSVWSETIDKALQAYRREAAQKLPNVK